MSGRVLEGPLDGDPQGATLRVGSSLAMSVFGNDVEVTGEIVTPPGSVSLSLKLGSMPVGRALAQLVTWAQSGRTVTFDPPWDRLFDLTLPPVTFTIKSEPGAQQGDPSTTSFAITAHDLSFDFPPFLSLTNLSLAYVPATGPKTRKVNVVIEGTFLGQKFDDQHPLTWDALSSPPPAVPTAIDKIMVLRYLGLGQRVQVEVQDSGGPNPTLWDVISSLKGAFEQPEPGKTPLSDKIAFAADGGWLVGIDFTLLDTLTLAALFDDPAMYGLHLALDGPKAGAAAGFEFDILYRKIGDNLGVYHAELTLPDALRHLDFGAIALTLPIISVDVYTNGNFLIDLGFPYQLDFSRSFGIQMLPFVGAGGFYFGILSQATATGLPSPANGTFSPVVAFGIGLQVGVGRTISYGVLSGGITVTVQGLIEGLIAGWRPGSGGDVAAIYYRLTGQVSISGHLYGAIDFVIIKASVDVYAYAGVALVMESHKPTLITLSAGVEVSVRVKIVFFTVHLSFSASIEESFEIGSASAAPWDAPAARARIVASPATCALPPARAWQHVDLVEVGVRVARTTVKVAFVPQVALGATAAGVSEVKLVAVCFTDAEMSGATTTAPTGTTSFANLAAALLDWGLHLAGGDGGTVSKVAIKALFDELATPEGDGGMTSETALEFIAENIAFELSDETGFDSEHVTVFPMLPWLKLDSPSAPAYATDFAIQTPAPAGYRDALGRYFAQLNPSTDGPTGAGRRAELRSADESPLPESLAAVVLADYCKLILRQLLGDALSRFQRFTLEPSADGPSTGWLASIGELYDLGPDAIDALAVANQSDSSFRSTWTISGARIQALPGETPLAFCGRTGVTLDDLASVAIDSQGFVAASAAVTVSHGSYTIVPSDVSRKIAGSSIGVATDVLTLVSARFGCSPTDLQAANRSRIDDAQWTSLGDGQPAPNPPPLAAKSKVTLPPLNVVAGPRSLRALAQAYGTSAAQLLADNATNATLIAPMFTVELPDFTLAANGATPLAIAQRFGLTVAGLVAANDGGESEFGPVVVPGSQIIPTGELTNGVLGGGAVTAASGAAARFLLHGLRLPAPDGLDLGASDALYALTGQQFSAPTQPHDAQLTLSPTATAGLATPVISFPGSEQLEVTLSEDAVATVDTYRTLPDPPFTTDFLGAASYPPYAVVPRRYALGRPEPWQRPTPWPDSRGGAPPRLYGLPASLLADLPAGQGGMVAAVLSIPGVAGGTPPIPTPVPDARWAVRADFTIRRVHGPGGPADFMPGMYELVSSVGDASAALLAAYSWIAADPATRTPTVELLYSAGGQAASAAGLRSDAVTPAAVALVKANLSTVTSKPAIANAAGGPEVLIDAAMDDPAFLQVLWECSTTNAGGYYLRYGATKLPESLFESAPLATLTVLVTIDEEPAVLRSFHNCMITGIDQATSKLSLDIEAYAVPLGAQINTLSAAAQSLGLTVADFGAANATNDALLVAGTSVANAASPGGTYAVQVGDDLLAVAQLMDLTVETAARALADTAGLVTRGAAVWPQPNWVLRSSPLPAGIAGFRITRTQPAEIDDVATAFHLLSYRVAAGGGFEASNDAMPIAPTTPTVPGVTTASPWRYQQVIPVSALAGGESPYAGVGGTVTLDVALQDLYGNRALPDGDPAALSVPVYYHDPLLAIGGWPGARLSFAAPIDAAGILDVTLELDVANTVAAAAGTPTAVASRAAQDFPRYATAAAQLACPGIEVALTSSLAQGAAQFVDVAALTAFARRAGGYLHALASTQLLTVDANGQGMSAVAQALGVDAATLARSNQDADGLFADDQRLTLPIMGAAVLQDTITAIAARADSIAADIGTWNAAVALAPGLVIQRGSNPYETKSGDTFTSLEPADPGGLATVNSAVAGLFAESTPLVVTTQDIAAGPASLRTIAAAASCTVDVLIALNGDVPLATGVSLVVPGRIDTSTVKGPADAIHVAGGNDTFANISATTGAVPSDVVRANAWTNGLLRPGRTVSYLKRDVLVRAGDTPASIAASFKALGVNVDPSALFVDEANDLAGMFAPGAVLLVPPAPIRTAFAVVPKLDIEPVVPLSVHATISRTSGVDPDLVDYNGVASATSLVAPDLDGATPDALRLFAATFENAFQQWDLALATSTGSGLGGASLYVVQIAESWDGTDTPIGIAYDFQPGAVAFDVPPVATEPWSGEARVASYVSGTGLTGDVSSSIKAADLDAIQQRALADLDRFLEPATALAVHSWAPGAVRDLVNAKYALAGAVSRTVIPVLKPLDGEWTGDRQAAITTMRQLMLVQSSQCYTTDALVQVRANVVTPFAESLNARLDGMPLVTAVVDPIQRIWTARAGDDVGRLLSAVGPHTADGTVRARFAEANADAPLEPGQQIVVGAAAHVVAQGETLSDVAAALGVGASRLVTEAPDAAAAAGHSWTLVGDQQPITLTPAKLALTNGESVLTFGVRVASLELHRNLVAQLAFRPAELEYHIEPIEGGYEESSWLTFINPRPEVPLGDVTVPLPLRAFPATPRITTQSWTQDHEPGKPDWSNLGAGQFRFAVQYSPADQDKVTVRVDTGGSAGLRDFAADNKLPIALVRYQAVADAVWADLSQIPSLATATDPVTRNRLTAAALAFSELIQGIASAWTPSSAAEVLRRPTPDEAIAVRTRSTRPVTYGPWSFDVPNNQRLWGVVDVVRNSALVDGRTTTSAFLYRLLNTRASAPVAPYVRYTGTLDLRQAPAHFGGGRLIDYVRNMFAAALGVTPGIGQSTCYVRVTSAWEFGFGSAAPIDAGGMAVPAPVYTSYTHAFDPQVDFDETSGYSFELATELAAWQARESAPAEAAQWCLNLSVHSMLAGSGAPGPPLLDIHRIVLPLATLR